MLVVNGKDFMEVKVASLVADYDQNILVNLYQPIIGFTGLAVYLSLLGEANNQKVVSLINHDEFFDRMKITAGQFVDARKLLEGIGLIKTYVLKSQGTQIFHYDVFSPRTPIDFFNNTLLYGMYIKAVGEQTANKMKNIYANEPSTNVGEDITASFVDAYRPDFDDPAFRKAMSNTSVMVGRTGAKIACEFSFEKFFEYLGGISQISSESFSKKDMKEIERLATLNGIDEKSAATGVSCIYDASSGKGKHIDFVKLAKIFQEETNYNYLSSIRNGQAKRSTVSSKSALAGKINIMETKSPKDFLSLLQNGSKPASSDLALVNQISSNFHLTNGVINALIDYVLVTNDNILSRVYCEKIAASLAREGVTCAVDAMNFLNNVIKGRKKKTGPVERKIEAEEEKPTTAKKTSKEEKINWNELLDAFDEGGSDGKA